MTRNPPRFELLVPPARAVAHAAAHLPAEPGARLRFRDHGDPCCFNIDVREPDFALPSRSFTFIARPERGGSRLELLDSGEGPPKMAVVLAVVGSLLASMFLRHLSPPLFPLPVLLTVLVLRLRGEPPDPSDEVFATVAQIFAPLRRADPYRDDATS